MRAVVQRVLSASVTVDGRVVSQIGPGLLTLLGVAKGDTEAQVTKLMTKVTGLRIFGDPATGKLDLGLLDVKGEHLIVSQFTLLGDCSQGRRPSFVGAEQPERARGLYELAIAESRRLGAKTEGGIFQADMKIALVNDGPVTLVVDL